MERTRENQCFSGSDVLATAIFANSVPGQYSLVI